MGSDLPAPRLQLVSNISVEARDEPPQCGFNGLASKGLYEAKWVSVRISDNKLAIANFVVIFPVPFVLNFKVKQDLSSRQCLCKRLNIFDLNL